MSCLYLNIKLLLPKRFLLFFCREVHRYVQRLFPESEVEEISGGKQAEEEEEVKDVNADERRSRGWDGTDGKVAIALGRLRSPYWRVTKAQP